MAVFVDLKAIPITGQTLLIQTDFSPHHIFTETHLIRIDEICVAISWLQRCAVCNSEVTFK